MFKNREQFREQARKAVALTLALLLFLPLLAALLPALVYAEDTLRAPTANLSVWKDEDGKPVATEDEVVWQWVLAPDEELPPTTWYITLSKGMHLKHVEADGTWDRETEIRNAEALSSDQNRTEPERIVETALNGWEPTSDNTNSTDFVERLWRLSDAEIEELLGEDGAAQAQVTGLTYYGVQTKETTEPQALRLVTVADGEEASAQMTVSTRPLATLPATEEIGREDTPATAWVHFARAEEPAEEADTEPEDTEPVESEEPDTEEDGGERSKDNVEIANIEEAKTEKAETTEAVEQTEPTEEPTTDPFQVALEVEEKNSNSVRNESAIGGSLEEPFISKALNTFDAIPRRNQMTPMAIVNHIESNGSGDLGLTGGAGSYSWSASFHYDTSTKESFIDWQYTVNRKLFGSGMSPYMDFSIPANLNLVNESIQISEGNLVMLEESTRFYAYSLEGSVLDYPPMMVNFRTKIMSWESDTFEIPFRPALRFDGFELLPTLRTGIDWHRVSGNTSVFTPGRDYTIPSTANLITTPARIKINPFLIIYSEDQNTNPIVGAHYLIEPGGLEGTTNENGLALLNSGLPLATLATIMQNSLPFGYLSSGVDQQSITIQNGPNEVIFQNTIIGDVHIQLQNDTSGIGLQGGVFELWSLDPNETEPIRVGTTDENGELVFKDVPIGGQYELRQTKAPDGRMPVIEPIIVTTPESPAGAVTDVSVTNEPLRIEVTLQNPNGVPIANSIFVLKDTSGNVVGESLITDANGKLTFMGEYLIYDDSYTVEQTGVPEGYVTAEPQSVTLEQATTELLFISPWKANLSVQLTDPDGRPLFGGVFVLKKDGTDEELEQSTDADGKAVWENLGAGTYSLKQKRAPEKHIPDPNTYKVTVDEFGSLKVTLGMDVIFADPLPIVNQPMTQFPATGGIGKEVFMIVGFVLMAGAGTVLRKMRTKPE